MNQFLLDAPQALPAVNVFGLSAFKCFTLLDLLPHIESAAVLNSMANVDAIVEAFNAKPMDGIQMALQNKVIADDAPERIARFLVDTPGLQRKQLGEYVCDYRRLPLLRAYIRTQTFIGLDPIVALRQLLRILPLPGEGSAVDRVIEEFAALYHDENPDRFKERDQMYTFTYALLLLNMDILHKQTQSRMKEEDFVRSGSGSGHPGELLRHAFRDLQANPLEVK